MTIRPQLWCIPALLCLTAEVARADDIAATLAKIKAVKNEGVGNDEASEAWKELVQLGTKALLPTLTAMDGADPTVTNWLRAAVDAIGEKALAAKQRLPAKELETFLLDRKHSGAGRRAAYDWLVRLDPNTPARYLPNMLDDPGAELRRDAVAVVIKEAEELLKAGDKDSAKAAFNRALTGARDEDQVDAISKQLKTLGVEVDLATHWGFIRTWHLITPFENSKGVGFKIPYPPEMGVDLKATYKGKEQAEAKWVEHTSKDPRGLIDLKVVLGHKKGVVAYAYTVIDSPKEQTVQIRAGCLTALKIFLNGKQVFAREEYHHGMSMDQHVGTATLKKGRNELLLKVCQNEQTEDWAQSWRFQVRLCDQIGTPVPFTIVDASEKKGEGK